MLVFMIGWLVCLREWGCSVGMEKDDLFNTKIDFIAIPHMHNWSYGIVYRLIVMFDGCINGMTIMSRSCVL